MAGLAAVAGVFTSIASIVHNAVAIRNDVYTVSATVPSQTGLTQVQLSVNKLYHFCDAQCQGAHDPYPVPVRDPIIAVTPAPPQPGTPSHWLQCFEVHLRQAPWVETHTLSSRNGSDKLAQPQQGEQQQPAPTKYSVVQVVAVGKCMPRELHTLRFRQTVDQKLAENPVVTSAVLKSLENYATGIDHLNSVRTDFIKSLATQVDMLAMEAVDEASDANKVVRNRLNAGLTKLGYNVAEVPPMPIEPTVVQPSRRIYNVAYVRDAYLLVQLTDDGDVTTMLDDPSAPLRVHEGGLVQVVPGIATK